MPTPQNLLHVLNDTIADREHSDESDDLATRGGFLADSNSPDITLDNIDQQHDNDPIGTSTGNANNETKVNQNIRSRTSSSFIEEDKSIINVTNKNNDKTLSYRNVYDDDMTHEGNDNYYPSSFYKRLIYSKHAQQISNAPRASKKKTGGISLSLVLSSLSSLLSLSSLSSLSSLLSLSLSLGYFDVIILLVLPIV